MSILHSMDIQKTNDVAIGRLALDFYSKPFEKSVQNRALKLARGVIADAEDIDKKISQQARNWDFSRIANIDKQIMRIAIYEVLNEPATPIPVAINEAVDISKIYSTKESGHFVNGILDKICKKKEK
ncbi:transcription antitermination factor NusB [bacterium]|nr:transcription antitermination factor NusB [bacterium]